MAWEQRGGKQYYYLSVREGNRVRRQYLGTGYAAAIVAAMSQVSADQRAHERALRKQEEAAHAEAIAPLKTLCELTDGLLTASLLEAGYHQHDRTWRKKRQPRHETDSSSEKSDDRDGQLP